MPVSIFENNNPPPGGSSGSPSSSSSGGGQDFLETLKKIPWWGYAIAGGALLGIVVYVRRSSSAASSGVNADVSASQNLPAGLNAADLAGLPFDYTGYNAAGAPGSSVGDPTATPTPTPTPAAHGGYYLDPSGQLLFNGVLAGPEVNPAQGPTPRMPAGGPTTPTTPTGSSAGTPTVHPAATPPPAYYHEVHAWPAWDSTLSGIAGHYGEGWQQLYNFGNNRQTVDSMAHEHGHWGDEYNWLFPGEEIQVPSNG